jgi:hypothetical protein
MKNATINAFYGKGQSDPLGFQFFVNCENQTEVNWIKNTISQKAGEKVNIAVRDFKLFIFGPPDHKVFCTVKNIVQKLDQKIQWQKSNIASSYGREKDFTKNLT